MGNNQSLAQFPGTGFDLQSLLTPTKHLLYANMSSILSHLPLKHPCCYLPFYKWGNQQNDHRASQSSMHTIHYQVLVFNNPLIVRKNLFSKKYKLPTCHLIRHPIQASSMGTKISVPTELDHLPLRPCLFTHSVCRHDSHSILDAFAIFPFDFNSPL